MNDGIISFFLPDYVKGGSKRKRPYLLLLATAAHTRRIAITARMVRVITSQSGGRKAGNNNINHPDRIVIS